MAEYRKQSHAVYDTKYHIVFGTKYRRNILKHGVDKYVLKTFARIGRLCPGVDIKEANTDIDHVHLFMVVPPKYAVADVVGKLKGSSAYAMRRRFTFLSKVYHGTDGIWSDGYFVSTSGINEEVIKNYIKHQGEADSGQVKLAL